MSCLINSGIENTCKTNSPGLYDIFIANYPSGVTSATDFVTYDAEGIITAFSGLTLTTELDSMGMIQSYFVKPPKKWYQFIYSIKIIK